MSQGALQSSSVGPFQALCVGSCGERGVASRICIYSEPAQRRHRLDGYRSGACELVLMWDWRLKSRNKQTQSTLTDSTVTNVSQLFVDEMLKSVLEDIFFHVVVSETSLISSYYRNT